MTTSPRPTALVAGASIAGPATAFWLSRFGWDVTVVERAPQPRSAGQNVDVRGVGKEVLRRAGLLEAVRARRTGEVGTAFITTSGRVAGRFPADGSDVDGATAELEILRGDLSGLFLERTRESVEYLFGERITAVDYGPDGARVHLSSGAVRHADVVVAADGLGSTTRDVMGLPATRRHLGLETSYFTMPRAEVDDDWWRWYDAGRGRSVQLRPDPYGTIRASLSVIVPTSSAAETGARTRAEQVERLQRLFADVGWHAPRVIEGLASTDDLYYEHLGQVRAPRWSTGRTVLVGDAAHCAAPLSGMGTTLALTGSHVLAGELTRARAEGAGHAEAFGRYEALMRPVVATAQKLPPGGPRIAHPRTPLGSAVLAGAVGVLASRPLRRLGDSFSAPAAADQLDLPPYDEVAHR